MMMIMILMIMMFHINDLNEYDIDVECEAMSVILRETVLAPTLTIFRLAGHRHVRSVSVRMQS